MSWVLSGKLAEILIWSVSPIVFVWFDLMDLLLCILYRGLDKLLEGNASRCYCRSRSRSRSREDDDREAELSETLYGRTNVFRELMGFFGMPTKWAEPEPEHSNSNSNSNSNSIRWSDCACHTCAATATAHPTRLHIQLTQPSYANIEDYKGTAIENVVFLHGFLNSSSFWTETVFPNLSESTKHRYKLFAVDLLGFGKSPKPRDCLYTLRDHIQMIEKSVIAPFQLNSFHLVAHSMGCIIALALASKYSDSISSITLVALPCFSSKEDVSLISLRILAKKTLWPPLLFGSSVMSWYEHLGRCMCFLICRNHRTWEWILKLLTRRRDLHFMVTDFTRHTHHSAWHSMHNVICGGAKLVEGYLQTLCNSGVKINLIHGSHDRVVPLECSTIIKMKAPNTNVDIITNADHNTVILGREEEFTRDLELIWASSDADAGTTN